MPKITKLTKTQVPYVVRTLTTRWECGQDIVEAEVTQYLRQQDSLCFILLNGKTPIGMCAFSKKNDVGVDKSPWLLGLWVEPEYRGNGYGQLLNKAVARQAQKLGYHKLYLDTDSALKYHERFGWKHIGTGSYLGEKTEIMELDILDIWDSCSSSALSTNSLPQ